MIINMIVISDLIYVFVSLDNKDIKGYKFICVVFEFLAFDVLLIAHQMC